MNENSLGFEMNCGERVALLREFLGDQARRVEREREQEDGGDPDGEADRQRHERALRDVAARAGPPPRRGRRSARTPGRRPSRR